MSLIVSPILVAVSLLVFCSALTFGWLPLEEADGLRYVGKTLGRKDWNFSAEEDPCSSQFGWLSRNDDILTTDINFESNITCSPCNATTPCHITHIILKGQNLAGTLPSDLYRLPYLEVFDLTRNYLSGQIPRQWGNTKLHKIALLANRLTGSVPKEIGNITTLEELTIESNYFSGSLPSTLGNLSNLDILYLASNNFTGELPTSLGMLTTLTKFRISDNNFEGKIPNFIRNWVNITRIVIQASGLSGPIPSEIGLLKKLTDLRMSDLNGASSPFPLLNNLTNIEFIELRNCNITGVLPDYFAEMNSLKLLDLSFNKISGQIPASYRSRVSRVEKIFLTGNLLNGTVPDWILQAGQHIDFSYNKFEPSNIDCQVNNMNFFSSSSLDNNFKLVSCLHNHTCEKAKHHLHINCGGKEETIDGVTFEGDENIGAPSQFLSSKTNWAHSITGVFRDDGRESDNYIASVNSSSFSSKYSKLYETARITPISLTYYVYCMTPANYTISLHFAEIMFTNDTTYKSLGRRIFDVYVQGRQVLKDFNIVDAAGGVGKAFIRKIPVTITKGTLEIRFYWAGKGTSFIPTRGVYGPLISAISVESNITDSDPPSEGQNTLPAGAIVGISTAVVLFIILALGTLWWRGCLGRKSKHPPASCVVLEGLNMQVGSFTIKEITTATNNFDTSNKLGEGGFGSVYKGILLDGTMIAVKQLSSKSAQGKREFVNEIGMISSLQHPYLVKLYGCCTQGDQLLLVYEYMENNNLARALFGPQECQLELNWPTRQKICIGIAKGLAFLHEESGLKIVHRDIKGTNILLDKNLNPKISDFGLAKLDEEENTHMTTRVAGTFGYMAPEYATRGYLSDKADVYSFGIVALEIVSGRNNTLYRSKDKCFYLLDWALVVKERGNLMELVDPRLGSDFDEGEALAMINIALLCTNVSPSARPIMSSVVSMLEGKAAVQELVANPNDLREEMNAMWNHMQQTHKIIDTGNQTESASSMDMPCSWTSVYSRD